METRKIQTVGGGTYTVSLPKEWAEREGVSAGAVVNLHTHIDGLLVVQTRERRGDATDRVVAEITHDDPERLERTVRAAYAAGSETVVLDAAETFTDEQRRTVERVTRNLTGVAVGEESDARITVQTLLDAEEVSIGQSVRQLEFVALSMHRDATAALTGDAAVDGSTDRDDQADRLYALIDRHFTRGLARLDEVDALGSTRPELFELWATARELERVADHAEDIVDVAASIDEPMGSPFADEFRRVGRAARAVVEDAVSVVVGDRDVERARRALNARDRLCEEIQALDRRLFETPACDYRLTSALGRMRRTAEHGGNIAELGLRAAVRRGELTESAAGAGDDNDREPDAPTGRGG